MDYKMIEKAYIEYEKMTPIEMYEQLYPIISSYRGNDLAKRIGISEATLSVYRKRSYAESGKKLGFLTYIKIMATGMNENPIKEKRQHGRKRLTEEERKKRKEEKEERLKEYQHRYYMEVTKKKREEKDIKH